MCICGHLESTHHYLLACPLFTDARVNLLNTVQSLTDVSLRSLLNGDESLSEEQNHILFGAVHNYIHLTRRLY